MERLSSPGVAYGLTRISSFLILLFAAGAVALHPAQPSFDPVNVALSYYMNGRLGWLLQLGLAALGLGSLLLLGAVYRTSADVSRTSLALLGAWGTAVIVAGVFPPDAYGAWNGPPSLSGLVHGTAAMAAFVAFPFAAVRLSNNSPFGQSRRALLRRLAIVGAVLTMLLFVCLAPVFYNHPPFALGLVERLALGAYVAWLLLANHAVMYATAADSPRSIFKREFAKSDDRH